MFVLSCYPHKASALDRLFDTLGHSIRREVIYYFEQKTEAKSTSLSELVAYLNDRMPSETEEELRIKLTQVHLPKLAHRDWLEYDRDTGRITYAGHEWAGQLLGEVRDLF